MQQATKQRVVGIAVLAALALIILPMILDFSEERRQRWLDIDVPPPPDPANMEVLPLGVWSEKVDPEVAIDDDLLQQAQRSDAAKAESPPKQDAAPPVKKQPAAPEPVAPKPAAPEVVTKTQPETSPAAPVSGWVVQVASFTSEEKAMALHDRLKTKGYATFVVSGKASATSRTFFRVRVGPQPTREAAEQAQRKIKTDTGLNGLVVHSR